MTSLADSRLGTVLSEETLKAAAAKVSIPTTGEHLEPVYLAILSSAAGIVTEEVVRRLDTGDDGMYQARASVKRIVFELLHPVAPEVLLQREAAKQDTLDSIRKLKEATT